MNNALTGLGLALVLALVAALVGPWFVDWNAYRADFARQASALIGAPVTVSGAVEARLLPSPYVRFRDVVAGAGDARLAASEIEIALSVGPLLRGDIAAERVRIIRPRLALAVGADGAVRAPFGAKPSAGPEAERVSFDNAEIVDGAIEIRSPAGRVALTRLDGVAEAGSLRGPYRFEGAATTPFGRTTLKLSTSRADAVGAIRLKLAAAVEGRPETLDLDGALTVAARPRFEGQGVLARPPAKPGPEPDDPAHSEAPWRLAATVSGGPARLAFEGLEAVYGPDDRAVRAQGSGALDLGAAPRFELALTSRQIDLDRMPGASTAVGPWPRLQALGARLQRAARPPLDGRVTLDVGGVVLAGDVVRAVRADVVTEDGAWRIARASAELPGETTLFGRGAVVFVDQAPGFAGGVDFATGDLGALRFWLHGGGDAPRSSVRRLAAKGDVTARVGAFTIDNATLTADGATSSGKLAWRAAEGGSRARIDADLDAERLDLEALGVDRLVSDALKGGAGADVALSLGARTLVLLGVAFDAVELQASLGESGLDIRRLSVGDAGGAGLLGAGRIEAGPAGPDGQLAFDVDARRLDGLIALARAAGAPETALGFVAARAGALAPAAFSLDVGVAASGRTLTARGTAAGGPFEARLTATAFARDGDVDLAFDLTSTDGRRVAALLGLPLGPAPSAEGGRMRITLKGKPARGMTGEADLVALGLDLRARGDLAVAPEAGLSASGDVTLRSPDIAGFAAAIGRLAPNVAPAVSVDLSAKVALSAERATIDNLEGTLLGRPLGGRLEVPHDPRKSFVGELAFDELSLAALGAVALSPNALEPGGAARRSAWPSTQFGPSPLGGLNGRVAIRAGRMPVAPGRVATDAHFMLTARPGATAIEELTADFAGGRLTGALTVSRPGLDATVSLRAGLAGARATEALGTGATSPVVGLLDLTIDAQGSGRTLSAVVSTLSGTGSSTLRAGALRGLDVAAIDRIEPAVEAGLALEAPKIAAALDRTIGAADLVIERATAPFTLSAGVLRSGAIDDGGAGPTRFGGAIGLDLSRLTLDADLTLAPRRDDAPQLGVSFEGPVGAPKRRIDATALTGWLSVRAVERETRRIEAMEAEIQERSRLAGERAAEERRRTEEKRKADEERKAQEALTKSEEDRRRREIEERRRREAEERARATFDQPNLLETPAGRPAAPGFDLPRAMDLSPGAGPAEASRPGGLRGVTPPRGVFDAQPR